PCRSSLARRVPATPRQCDGGAGPERDHGDAEPPALTLARVGAEGPQHHPVAGSQLAATGEDRGEPLPLRLVERARAPLGIALDRAGRADHRLAALDRLAAATSHAALGRREEHILGAWGDGLDRVE